MTLVPKLDLDIVKIYRYEKRSNQLMEVQNCSLNRHTYRQTDMAENLTYLHADSKISCGENVKCHQKEFHKIIINESMSNNCHTKIDDINKIT